MKAALVFLLSAVTNVLAQPIEADVDDVIVYPDPDVDDVVVYPDPDPDSGIIYPDLYTDD